jgi:hypothetical protein
MKRTLTEGQLAALGLKASLSLWCYPSPFRNQGNGKGGDGKEIADLLIVFGQHIVIFSDKACDYPAVADARTAWSRWFRAAVLGAAKQLRGAKRWIREHPDRVFADKGCSMRLAVDLAAISMPVFHLVAVVHDKTGRRAAQIGGSGSLIVDPEVLGNSRPLHIGRIDRDWPVIHVWDETVFRKVLHHLDTAPDLIAYLDARAALIQSNRLLVAAGEEDLLAVYLTNINAAGDHVFPGVLPIAVGDRAWFHFARSPEYASYIEANRSSYLWDHIIEKTVGHALQGTSTFDSTKGDPRKLEQGFRIMASERRIARRSLATALINGVNAAGTRQLYRTIPWAPGSAATYVFFICPRFADEEEDAYRERRQLTLQRRIEWSVAKGLADSAHPVLGIAVDAGAHLKDARYSEDVIAAEFQEIDEAWRQEMLQFGEAVGWGKLVTRRSRTNEYPAAILRGLKKRVGRNEACPCGSGIKFKRCCGVA